jgi:lipid A 3-O-deacylase
MNILRLLVPASIGLLAAVAGAADLRPAGAFIEGGLAQHEAYSVTAGLLWPWSWRRSLGQAELSGITEAYVSQWSAKGATTERHNYTQIGVVPVIRVRPDAGRSPWFLEGGIGLSAMDRLYRNQARQFSTSFNFADVVGIGHSFGADRRREVSLRISHFSNAGIKEPNPGETFLQLRYAMMF